MPTKEFKFKIGADPEFNMELYNKRLNAKETITRLLSKNENFESNERDGFKLKNKNAGTLGWDGHSSTGEIRPEANNSPEGVIENLGEIFKEFNKAAPLFEISTLSRASTLGGHIHLELPGGQPKVERMKGIHKRMISFYLPIIMGENKTNIAIRMKGGYGNLCSNSAYRVDNKFTRPDGTPGFTYELRCPSAEWTVTPKIAKSTLAYIGVVYHEIMKHPKKFEETCRDIIIRTDKQGDAIQELVIGEYKTLTHTLLNKIKKYIKTFELYDTFKEEIEYILKPEQVIADKQNANFDIRQGWNLLKNKKEPLKKTILSEKAFKKRIKEKDLDTISSLVNIAYNEDANVDIFAQRITQTVAAFDLNLKKEYFLYGVRKGINSYIVANKKTEKIIGTDQIQTTSDEQAIKKLVDRMRVKAKEIMGEEETTKRLNFKTGKNEEIKKEIILIGIPYEDRMSMKTTKLIELIYDIEKGKIKKPTRNNKNITNDTDLPETEKGHIYKKLNKIETEETALDAIVIDDSSDTSDAENRIEQITREEEVIENETEQVLNAETILPGEETSEESRTSPN